jgi:hypothetical protein
VGYRWPESGGYLAAKEACEGILHLTPEQSRGLLSRLAALLKHDRTEYRTRCIRIAEAYLVALRIWLPTTPPNMNFEDLQILVDQLDFVVTEWLFERMTLAEADTRVVCDVAKRVAGGELGDGADPERDRALLLARSMRLAVSVMPLGQIATLSECERATQAVAKLAEPWPQESTFDLELARIQSCLCIALEGVPQRVGVDECETAAKRASKYSIGYPGNYNFELTLAVAYMGLCGSLREITERLQECESAAEPVATICRSHGSDYKFDLVLARTRRFLCYSYSRSDDHHSDCQLAMDAVTTLVQDYPSDRSFDKIQSSALCALSYSLVHHKVQDFSAEDFSACEAVIARIATISRTYPQDSAFCADEVLAEQHLCTGLSRLPSQLDRLKEVAHDVFVKAKPWLNLNERRFVLTVAHTHRALCCAFSRSITTLQACQAHSSSVLRLVTPYLDDPDFAIAHANAQTYLCYGLSLDPARLRDCEAAANNVSKLAELWGSDTRFASLAKDAEGYLRDAQSRLTRSDAVV